MFYTLKKTVWLAIGLCGTLWAQVPTGKLWLLHEGPFGGSGAVGYVQYPGNTYTQVAAMDGTGNDMLFNGNVLYAVGGGAPSNGSIFRIDTTTKQVLDTLKNLGARRLAMWQGKLLVTGYQDAKRFRVLDPANAYQELWSLGDDKLTAEAEGIVVDRHLAWVSLPGFFGTGDRVAVIDLQAQDTVATIAVPTNPLSMALVGPSLYVQSINYSGLGLIVTQIDTASHTVLRSDTTYIDTYGTFLPVGDRIWFGEVNPNVFRTERIRAFNTTTHSVDNAVVFDIAQKPSAIQTLNIYSVAHHNGYTFVSDADYTNPDSLFVWDGTTATQLRTVGISARVLRFQPYQNPTAVLAPAAALAVEAWPVPLQQVLHVRTAVPASFTLTDVRGRVLRSFTTSQLEVADLPAGVYFLQAQAPGYTPTRLRLLKY
jgi:hypothetical protein